MRLRHGLLAFAVALAASGASAAPITSKVLDEHVGRAQRAFSVPGISVAVVEGGKSTLARGYGVRRLGDAAPVDAHTLFAIASNSKSFTAAALAILVDEGKLHWDDPVQAHEPSFQLSDPYASRATTLRDVLAHRTGLGVGAGDLLYWPTSTYLGREILRRARWVPMAHGFRERFAYSNLSYAIVGELFPRLAGEAWGEFVTRRILVPLDMRDTRATLRDAAGVSNAATPHVRVNFTDIAPIRPQSWDNVGAAGGIWSSAVDMAKWVSVQLAEGEIPGSGQARLYSEARQREMWTVVSPRPPAEFPAHLWPLRRTHGGYALGWNVTDYRGELMVQHTGGLQGMYSLVTLLPRRDIAIVVLANLEIIHPQQAITYGLLDRRLDVPVFDWVAAFSTEQEREHTAHEEDWRRHVAARGAAAEDLRMRALVAGRYRDDWYGDVTVDEQHGTLIMRFSATPALEGELEHWRAGTYLVRWRDRGLNADAFVTFSLGPDGDAKGLSMESVSPLTDWSFDFEDLRLRRVQTP
jgi:CubicO group peptidase (beta-lactamase class C family)